MSRKNIFEGDSYHAIFAGIIYKRIISRGWFSNADIMVDYVGLNSISDLSCPISKCPQIKELTKALSNLKKMIGPDNFEEAGNNRNKRFRYKGVNDDPLAELRNAKVINDLKQYWQFCQDSAGFFPSSWIEYFFRDSKDLIEIKTKRKKGEQVLSTGIDRTLTNIELLPFLYEAIIHKQVLSVEYKPYDEDKRILTFHPHYLKEFNGRWSLLGHAEGLKPELGYNIALDRLEEKPLQMKECDYIPAPAGYYEKYFHDIVGVSHMKGLDGQQYPVYPIHIRAHSYYIYKLTDTKKIHPSQTISIPYGEHVDGTYGEFVVHVELNNEFIGCILQMGAGLEVVAPDEVRTVFKKRVADLAKLYK